MNSTIEALDFLGASNFAASPNSAYSPICHCTRQQSAVKQFTGACDDQEVTNIVRELVSEASCVPPNVSPIVCAETKALDNFEACLTSSFSVCHRTRQQLANREIKSVLGENNFSPVPDDSSHVFQLVENALLEQEVLDSVSDMLNRISPNNSPCELTFDTISPPVVSGTFFQMENILSPIPMCTSPCGITFDGSSPLAKPRTFFQKEEHLHASAEAVPSTETDEVTLFPSDLEVRDLLFEKSPSASFDFVKLTCVRCRLCFSSASGLEHHMKDQHDITILQNKRSESSAPSPPKVCSAPPLELLQVGPCSGPPHCAPFRQHSPC
ncbi:hypothetical protein CEXT_610051 [Caerostris extrusa]|uniref:C2H2-type domain-containing protein n=1 Tax=Caerostris extrusa TaxID=172846 RepID=A0AAV4Y3A4_CAEEX|nr:hypothetical protein CEXT_610051 [Caerostris extrusa]